MKTQAERNIWEMAQANLQSARKHIPIASRATINSAKVTKKGNNTIILESINHKDKRYGSGGRYKWKKANKAYRVPAGSLSNSGKVIPAGKNAGKFEWFHKGHEDAKKKIKATRGVIK